MKSERLVKTLDLQRKNLPDSPGVYLFRDGKGGIIYIGKAKSLKKRVASYFNKNVTGKTKVLVKHIEKIEHIVVDNESDALLLENNLIKKSQPRYNILLKDDKSFPWIRIRNEPFPRVMLTRNLIQDGSEYYGPYTSALMVRTLLDLIRKLYPLRTCKYNLSERNILKRKFRTCLEYHLGNCKAPCIEKQTVREYEKDLNGVRQILKGNIREVTMALQKEMKSYAGNYQFEKAQLIKEKLELIERYRSKTVIVNPALTNLDVFSYVEKNKLVVINYLNIVNGAVVQSHTVEARKVLEEKKEDILELVICQLRERFGSKAKETVVPFRLSASITGTKSVVPSRGDKKKLLDLSERNARIYLTDREKRAEKTVEKKDMSLKLDVLRKDLRMQEKPVHIECFDNSNLQGTSPVAACVVFRNGRPSKKEYRHFHIKTVKGADDFSSMKEVVGRRYRRLLEEGRSLPQLVVIDGGKGQLNAAKQALDKLDPDRKIAVIGIAKKLEEIYFPNDPVPLYLDKTGFSLKIIRHLRDEAHRFGITFHRKKRSGRFLQSSIAEIPGIGEKTMNKLLKKYKSPESLLSVDEEELIMLIGKSKTEKLLSYLEKGNG